LLTSSRGLPAFARSMQRSVAEPSGTDVAQDDDDES
jgi:hypothetical protein